MLLHTSLECLHFVYKISRLDESKGNAKGFKKQSAFRFDVLHIVNERPCKGAYHVAL